MDTETIIAIVCAGIGVLFSVAMLVLAIYFLVQFVRGKRSLDDVRAMLRQPPGEYPHRS